MKKDIEEIKIILAEIKQRIMYIEECERRQSPVKDKRQRQSKTLKGMERTEKEDQVTIQWQGSDNKQQPV